MYTNGRKVIYNNEVRVEKIRFALLFFACSFIYLSRYKMKAIEGIICDGSWLSSSSGSASSLFSWMCPIVTNLECN